MTRTHVYCVQVHFGDCDPAGIVFFPNFARWMDQASLAYFAACGVPPWRELERTSGIIGTPVLETRTRFLLPATYGETLDVHTSVESWASKTFTHRHQVRRGDALICDSSEVRAFVVRDAQRPGRLKAVAVPDDIRLRCA